MTTDKELENAFKEFFEKLASEQKPLEPEFDKILKDNAWELYKND